MPGAMEPAGLVSVIVAAHNHESHIRDTILSVVEQAYQNIELIVVDASFHDDTWAVLKRLESSCRLRFARTVFQRHRNQDIWTALNRLLALSNGQYIMKVSPGDLMKPHSIQCLVEFLNENPQYGLAVGDNELIDDNGEVVFWDRNRNNVYSPDEAEWKTFADFLKFSHPEINFNSDQFGAYSNFLVDNHVPNGCLVRKSALSNIKFTDQAPSEDHYMMLQLSKGWEMKYFDEVLHVCRYPNANATQNTAHPTACAIQTKRYEVEIIKNLIEAGADPDGIYAKALNFYMESTKKTKIKLGNFFELYKAFDFCEEKKYILKIMGKSFCLLKKTGIN